MKKLIYSTLAISLLAASCQKDITQQQLSTPTDSQAVAATDTVKFYGWAASLPNVAFTGQYTNVFSDYAETPTDTGYYFKKAVFVLHKSNGSAVKRARLYVWTRDTTYSIGVDITGKKDGDSIIFVFKTPIPLLLTSSAVISQRAHRIQLFIKGTGATGEWIRVRLKYAVFLKKYPQPQVWAPVSGLSEVGPKCIY